MTFYLNKKSTKKTKSIIKKLGFINSDVRDRLINIYVQKCMINFCITLAHWINKIKGTTGIN
jgi:hypothetical protein